ncbi:MAG: DUF5615 family PIN-like protein [Deltaproteobacteria bacterium]|nr:DUF5615 family PIN-like protein [Deltaproteobacteria bacterium]
MSIVKFHLDENVNPAVAEGLRLRGFNASTTVGQRLLHASDDKQLRVATASRRALFSHDVTTLPSLHAAWVAAGREHAGIILAPARPVGVLVRALAALAREVGSAGLRGQLVWLSAWLRRSGSR